MFNRIILYFIKIFFLILFLNKGIYSENNLKSTDDQINNKVKYKIIFIHGSYEISFKDIAKFTFYKIFNEKKFIKHCNKLMQNRFSKEMNLHTSICNNDFGLQKITKSNISSIMYNFFLKYIIMPFEGIFKNNLIEYYMFNWSGLLLDEERKKNAFLLYNELKQLQDNNTQIILIGYSHGGNIALELATIAKENNDKNFYIEMLILLASPLNTRSQKNACMDTFQKIFNFYSACDIWQIGDVFSGVPFLTLKRKLCNRKNIWNIEVKYIIERYNIKKRSTIGPHHKKFGNFHEEDIPPSFLFFLVPSMVKLLNSKNKNILLKIDIRNNTNFDIFDINKKIFLCKK